MTGIKKLGEDELLLPELPNQTLPAIEELTKALGIPRNVLASDVEIQYAWRDLPREIKGIPLEKRDELIARMCVAVSTGLFDGAVNYVWNAAILNLREKVRNFGLSVVAQIRQHDFEEKHLLELQDSRLIELCLKLNLIDEDGFFFLDQCRDVRNNYSAAHPTIGNLNDREFITFVNRCVKYALGNSSSPKGVDIGAFLSAIKGARFTDGQKKVWVQRLEETHDAQRQLLVGMVHGVFCDPATEEEERLNCTDICDALKPGFTNAIRSDIVARHSEYLAAGDDTRHSASQQFFERLGLLSLLNESEQHLVFKRAVERLMAAHQRMNNFYNEPPFAERLLELSQQGKVPETIQQEYVETVIGCYIGNGYGASWAAESTYEKMIKGFSPREVFHMVKAASREGLVARKISMRSCAERYAKALSLIDPASVPSSAKADFDTLLKRHKG